MDEKKKLETFYILGMMEAQDMQDSVAETGGLPISEEVDFSLLFIEDNDPMRELPESWPEDRVRRYRAYAKGTLAMKKKQQEEIRKAAQVNVKKIKKQIGWR